MMRLLISIVGFILFIVGCQQLVPHNYKYGTLPTHEYGQAVEPKGPLATIKKVCLGSKGLVRIKGNEITCTLEGK